MSRPFWPVHEQSQADYEALREAVLAGHHLENLTSARFARRGLAGLIAWPRSEALYSAVLIGAERPPWTPYADPRLEVLANSYELILTAFDEEELIVPRQSLQ